MKRGGLIVLADIPEVSADLNPRSRITIARMGKYQDARYGKFEIGETEFAGWQKNLSETFANKIAIDFDHSSDRGRGTEAAAWITGLEREGKDLIASVEWTPKGAAAVRDKTYQFISPTYVANYRTERGEERGPALIGGGLTNRPVLRQLPTLSLSRTAFDGVATSRKQKAKAMSKKKLKKRAKKLQGLPPQLKGLRPPKVAMKKVKAVKPKKLRKLAIAAGEAPDRARLMSKSGTDPELRALWLQSIVQEHSPVTLDADVGDRARLMSKSKVDPELRTLFIEQMADGARAPSGRAAPLGMDDDRFKLHTDAKQLAQARCDANPRLDEAEAYSLAAIEIADRQNPGVI